MTRIKEIENHYKVAEETFSNYLLYEKYEEGLFWMKDRVFFMLEIEYGIDYYALQEDVFVFYDSLKSLLRMFPSEIETTIQSFYMPFRDIFFEPDKAKTLNPASKALYKEICQKIEKGVKEGYFDASSRLREVKNYLIISFERPKSDWKSVVERAIDKTSQLVHMSEKETYLHLKKNAMIALRRQGVKIKDVDADEFIYLMFTLLNQDLDPLRIEYSPNMKLNQQLCYNLVTIDHYEVKYSSGSWLMMSLLNMKKLSYGFLSDLLSLQRPFYLSVFVHKPNQALVRAKLWSDKNLMSRFNKTVALDLNWALNRLDAGDLLFEAEITLGVFCKSVQEIDTVKAELADFISEYGWDLHFERSIGQSLFVASLPAHFNDKLERRMLLFEEHAVGLMNFRTMRPKFNDTGIPLVMTNLSPKKIDIFKTTAYGTMISGGSGSGKTFFTQYLALVKHALGEKIFVIDPVGNYEELCTLLGGEYRRIGLSNDTYGLNIFPDLGISEEEKAKGTLMLKTEEQKGMLSMLSYIIGRMIYLSEDKSLSSEELSVINDALNELYIKIPTQEMGLSTFVSTLESFGENRKDKRKAEIAYRLARALDIYRGNQMYSGLISDKPEEFKNPLTVFDVSAVKDDQNLLELTITAIMTKISEEVIKDPSKRKNIFIDEAHYLIRSKKVVDYIGRGIRVWRTFNAALVLITQQLSDLLDNKEVGEGIFKTINNFFILRQSAKSLEAAQSYLGYNDMEKEAMSSLLMTLPGKYSRLSYYSQDFGDGSSAFGIFYLSLPKKTLCAFTTNPDEKALRKKLIDQYSERMPRQEAVKKALEEMAEKI